MQFKDYYDILGVAPDAGDAAIKTAYRRLARKYHPDVSKEANAEERFKAVNEAYEALKEPQRRAAYDRLRARGYRDGEEFRPPPDFGQGFEFDLGEGGGGGFSDFFESLFGRARSGPRAGTGGPSRRAPADERARLALELETVFAGGTERIVLGGRSLDVRIPRGIAEGRQIRLAKQGRGGGDLLLEIEYRPHPHFTARGRDIHSVLPVAPWEAALGAEVSVQTLAGPVQLKIPAGSDSGKRLRLRARGMPGHAGHPDGDHIVELQVRVPPAHTEAQREAYQRLAEESVGFDPRG